MSIKKSIIVLSVLILASIFSGCKKEEIVDPPVQNQKKILSQVFSDSNNYRKFYYSNERLEKYEEISNGKLILSVAYSFDAQGKIEKEEVIHGIDNREWWINNYLYDEKNRVNKVELNLSFDGSSFEPHGYFLFHYNNKDQQISREYFNYSDTLREKTEYIYNAYGDCVKRSWYVKYVETLLIFDITTLEYDTNSNPELDNILSLGNAFTVSKHNVSKVVSENYNQNSEKIGGTVNSYVYVYDSDGYPQKRTLTYSDSKGFTSTLQETYIYK